jgi:hypothetical protein
MRSHDAATTRGDRSFAPNSPLLGVTLPAVSDLVPPGWLTGTIRDRTRGAFPASLSRAWGETCWTARDLWSTSPAFTAARASAAVSNVVPPVDVEALERRYRRLRESTLRRAQYLDQSSAPEVDEAPTPTGAMLALSAKVATWTATGIVIALALVVILLGFELGVFDALRR